MDKKHDTLADPQRLEFFEDGKLFIKNVEDIESVLDENAYARNHQGNNGFGKSRVWRKVGSIPCVVVEQILREKGVNILDGSPEADKYIRKFLDDNYKFRTVDKI